MDGVSLLPSADGVSLHDMRGFFGDWPQPPSLERQLEILRSAHETIVARSADGTLIGFITAITDGHFAASIPLLEVLPQWQHRGIGSELTRAMLTRLRDCYMIDLVCDDDVVPFYERLGATRLNAMAWRHVDQLQR